MHLGSSTTCWLSQKLESNRCLGRERRQVLLPAAVEAKLNLHHVLSRFTYIRLCSCCFLSLYDILIHQWLVTMQSSKKVIKTKSGSMENIRSEGWARNGSCNFSLFSSFFHPYRLCYVTLHVQWEHEEARKGNFEYSWSHAMVGVLLPLTRELGQ